MGCSVTAGTGCRMVAICYLTKVPLGLLTAGWQMAVLATNCLMNCGRGCRLAEESVDCLA